MSSKNLPDTQSKATELSRGIHDTNEPIYRNYFRERKESFRIYIECSTGNQWLVSPFAAALMLNTVWPKIRKKKKLNLIIIGKKVILKSFLVFNAGFYFNNFFKKLFASMGLPEAISTKFRRRRGLRPNKTYCATGTLKERRAFLLLPVPDQIWILHR